MYGTSIMSGEQFAFKLMNVDRLEAERGRLSVECAQEQADAAILARLQRRLDIETRGKVYVMAPSPSNMTAEERRVWRAYERSRGPMGAPSMACAYLKAVEDRLEELRSQPQAISIEPPEEPSTAPWKAVAVGAVVFLGLAYLYRRR